MSHLITAKQIRTYYGWVVVEDSGERHVKDTIWVEYKATDGTRRRTQMTHHGEQGCVDAVEWWDKRTGKPVKLEPALKGCYRVYTETREEESNAAVPSNS